MAEVSVHMYYIIQKIRICNFLTVGTSKYIFTCVLICIFSLHSVTVTVSCSMEFLWYPFDCQKCELIFQTSKIFLKIKNVPKRFTTYFFTTKNPYLADYTRQHAFYNCQSISRVCNSFCTLSSIHSISF